MKINLRALNYLLNGNINISKLVEKLNILGFESNVIENYLDINVPYNRQDCNNLVSILSEVKNFDKNFLIKLLNDKKYHKISNDNKIKIKNFDKKFCPIYSYAVIDNLNIKKHNIPDYIQETLKLNDINSVNSLIDLTNYATIITGQPFHCYDLNCISNEISIKKTISSCVFHSINGLKINLPSNIFIIKNKENIISVPGIIGSFNSKVSEFTQKILLESAFFDSNIIKNMEDKLNIFTDSSRRFANKINFELTLKSLNYAAELIKFFFSSKISFLESKIEKKYLPKNKKLKVNKIFFLTLLNNNVNNEIFSYCISNIYLEKKKIKKSIIFDIPHNRKDLEIKENIFSEIVKFYGYNNILPIKLKNSFLNENIKDSINDKITYFLKSVGFNEIISYSFVDSEVEKIFNINENYIYIKNPISEKMNVMRKNLIQGLIRAVTFNVNRKNNKLNLFEIGNVYEQCKINKFKIENVLSLIITDKISENDNFFYIKNIVNNLLKMLFNIEEIDFVKKDYNFFNKKISLSILSHNKEIGCIGLIKKDILNFLNLKQEVYYSSLFLDKLDTNFQIFFEELSKYPYVTRDLSIVFTTIIFYKDIIDFIKNLKINHLIKISFLDFYNIDNINKSLTLRFKFCSKIKTLIDAEICDSMNIIQNNLKTRFNIEIKM